MSAPPGLCLALGWQSSKLWGIESFLSLGWRQDEDFKGRVLSFLCLTSEFSFGPGNPKQRLLPGRGCRGAGSEGRGVGTFGGSFTLNNYAAFWFSLEKGPGRATKLMEFHLLPVARPPFIIPGFVCELWDLIWFLI